MNQQQRKYAKERLEQIYLEKLCEIERKNTKDRVVLSQKERIKALNSGEFKVVSGIEVHSHSSLLKVISFNNEKPRSRNSAKIKKLTSLLNAERQKALDELMLGDCEKAIDLISKLEKFKA